MAKQKKNKKPQKDKIPKYEHRKFHSLIIVPYALVLLIYMNFEKVCYICAKTFSKENYFLYQPKISFFLIMFFVLLFVLMIVDGVFIDSAKKLELKFNDYFSLKNIKAKKQVKRVVIQSVVVILLCALFFYLGGQSKYVADDTGIISYSLFQNSQEYINYDDVTSVEIRGEYHSGVHTLHSHVSGEYQFIVILNTNTKQFVADEVDFGNDYSKIADFLEIFDAGIVNADKETIKELQRYNNSSNNDIIDSILSTY